MTRRTALRGAAWTASAVTIVVATPDIASASTGALEPAPLITVEPGAARRSTNDRNQQSVIWPLRITAVSALQNLTVIFSGVSAVTDLTVTSGDVTWSGTGLTTRLYGNPLAVGDQLAVTAVFARSSNGRDPKVIANFVTGSPAVNLGGTEATIVS